MRASARAGAPAVNLSVVPVAEAGGGRYIPPMWRSNLEPDARQGRLQRLRAIPVRRLVPNVITLLALCAGLTGIRLAQEGRYELALGAIVFAAALDAIDGRVARLFKATSRFGAELDSLADFFNFGVAPCLILYFWGLQELGNLGWIACMAFAICAALRLARFNVQIEDPLRPAWAGNFFTGIPAPAGAITVLLPIYLSFLGVRLPAIVIMVYTLVIAGFMVSRLPVLSGKQLGTRVRPDLVPPVIVAVILLIALLVSYPWHVLTASTVIYLACLPLGWFSYQKHIEADKAARPVASAASPEAPLAPPSPSDDERPVRLN